MTRVDIIRYTDGSILITSDGKSQRMPSTEEALKEIKAKIDSGAELSEPEILFYSTNREVEKVESNPAPPPKLSGCLGFIGGALLGFSNWRKDARIAADLRYTPSGREGKKGVGCVLSLFVGCAATACLVSELLSPDGGNEGNIATMPPPPMIPPGSPTLVIKTPPPGILDGLRTIVLGDFGRGPTATPEGTPTTVPTPTSTTVGDGSGSHDRNIPKCFPKGTVGPGGGTLDSIYDYAYAERYMAQNPDLPPAYRDGNVFVYNGDAFLAQCNANLCTGSDISAGSTNFTDGCFLKK